MRFSQGGYSALISASVHLHLGCHESFDSGKITDITMDSTSKLGALTASFLSSFNGRSCLGSLGKKVEKKKSWRVAGEHHRGQGKQVDEEAKTLKEAPFPWHFDTDSIKKTAGIFLACSRDNANPCPLTGQDLQGEADAKC